MLKAAFAQLNVHEACAPQRQVHGTYISQVPGIFHLFVADGPGTRHVFPEDLTFLRL